jgi:hypothetical protein
MHSLQTEYADYMAIICKTYAEHMQILHASFKQWRQWQSQANKFLESKFRLPKTSKQAALQVQAPTWKATSCDSEILGSQLDA